jgi:hypothetical protein
VKRQIIKDTEVAQFGKAHYTRGISYAIPDNRAKKRMTSLQKGDLLTTETAEIAETKDNFIFH